MSTAGHGDGRPPRGTRVGATRPRTGWQRGRRAGWWCAAVDRAAYGAVCLLPVEAVAESDGSGGRRRASRAGRPSAAAAGGDRDLIRFWLARDRYQAVSPAQSLIATQFARHFLTTSGLAVTLMPFAQPEDWAAFCAYADQRRAPTADFTVGAAATPRSSTTGGSSAGRLGRPALPAGARRDADPAEPAGSRPDARARRGGVHRRRPPGAPRLPAARSAAAPIRCCAAGWSPAG